MKNFIFASIRRSEINDFVVEEAKKTANLQARWKADAAMTNMNEQKSTQDTAMVQMLNENLEASKSQQNNINASRANKQRLVEINTYYNKKYTSQIDIIKYIIKFMMPQHNRRC